MNLKQRAAQLQADIPALLLALKKKETPLAAKLLAGLTVAYALSPIDLIPDFIPVLGFLDDLLILPALVFLTLKLIPKQQFLRCREEAQGMWDAGGAQRWYFAVPVILIWLLIIFLIVKAII